MLPEIMQRLRQNKAFKLSLIIGASLLLVLVLIVILSRTEYTDYTLTHTPLKLKDDFGHLSGPDLYAYNGLAFYKTNLTSGDTTALSSGAKLPTPSDVYWADSQGALLNFEASFTLTQVEQLIRSRGQRLNESTKSYTWYHDFSDGSLHLVNEAPVQSDKAVFSATDKGFYYIPDFSQQEDAEFYNQSLGDIPLHFYNIDTKQSSVIANDLDVTAISHLSTCPGAGQKICVIAKDKANTRTTGLYEIHLGGQKNKLLETNGRLFPTNSPDLYISVDLPDESKSEAAEDSHGHVDVDVDFPPMPAKLHNITSKTTADLGFKVADEDIMPYFTDTEEFYVLSNNSADESAATYTAGAITKNGTGKTEKRALTTSDGEQYSGNFITTVSYGGNGVSLVASLDGDQLLFAPKNQVKAVASLGQTEAQKVVNECVKASAGKDSQYFNEETLFKVFFIEDNNLANNVKSFSDCLINKNSQALVGYNYYFGTVDAFNGRITSD